MKPDDGRTTAKRNIVTGLVALYNSESFGVRSLLSVLKGRGKPVCAVFLKDLVVNKMDDPTEQEYELVLKVLKDNSVDLVALSVRSPFLRMARELTARVRAELGVPVLWGGTHATVSPGDCLRFADMVCVGEGEEALVDVVEALEKDDPVDGIMNIWTKDGESVVETDLRPLVADLDSLPTPDLTVEDKFFVDMNQVSVEDPLLKNTRYDIMASRGCPFTCSYCTNSVLKKLYENCGPFIRRRSVSNVLDELKAARKRLPRMRKVFFLDENFVTSKKWLAEFAARYPDEVGLPFMCEVHPTFVTERLVGLLKEAGLIDVSLGIQSGSESVRMNELDRKVSDAQMMEAMRILKEAGIRPTYDIIVDTPFDTAENLEDAFNFVYGMPRPYNMNFFSMVHFPGTPLTDRLIREGRIDRDEVEGKSTKTLSQWRMSLDYERSKMNQFYGSLFALLSKSFVPKFLVKLMSRSKILKRNPRVLKPLVALSNYVKLFGIGVRMFFRGEITLHMARKRLKDAGLQK
ncbi:MAG: B12-binding domain-containing radical SAM protein [Terriglobia bacterium]